MFRPRSAFFVSLETILLLIGVYLIAINIISLGQSGQFVLGYQDELFDFNVSFQTWHSQGWKFKGFQWFWWKIETWPGLNNTITFISNFAKFGNIDFGSASDVISFLQLIGDILMFPVKLLVLIVADVGMNLMWFIGFIM